MKNNVFPNKFYWAYLAGFFTILALPILVIPPYFFPPDWGKAIVFRSICALLLLLFTWQFFYQRQELNLSGLKKNKIIWALGALLSVFVASTIFSIDPYFSLWGNPHRGGGLVTLACYFIFAVLAFIIIKKEDWQKVWDFSIIVGATTSLIAVIQYYGLFSRVFVPGARPASTMGNPILLAIYLLLLLFLTISFAIKANVRWKKIGYIGASVLFLYAILLTGSRAAYLGTLVGFVYFFIFYPVHKEFSRPKILKRINIAKLAIAGLIALVLLVVLYVNMAGQYPAVLQKNKLFNSIAPRLLIKNFLSDSRFAALPIEFNMVKARPILGYGLENFPVGFDKYYDPANSSLLGIVGWWDRAHNIIIETASDAGILGLAAYFGLFVVLFWQIYKARNASESPEIFREFIVLHAIGATLISYLVANLFSFDSFGSYLIFFLLAGYLMHLVLVRQAASQEMAQDNRQFKALSGQKRWLAPASVAILTCAIAIFLWQYNIMPFSANAKINIARNLAQAKQCDQAFALMDNVLAGHTLADSFARLEYGEFTKTCANWYPDNNLAYLKKGIPAIEEAAKIQPLYTRYWIYLGSAQTALATAEQDATAKNALLAKANEYFDRAAELAPKHPEVITGRAYTQMIAGNYKQAEEYSRQCMALNNTLGDCYWYLALAQIYQKNTKDAQVNIDIAKKSYDINSRASLQQLANAYGSIKDWQSMISIYKKLIDFDPKISQYHSSLAFFYREAGDYIKARQEAMIVLQLSPESKANVEAFLATLPR
ncbi:O-antigen ligase family protein [Candidatus Parcubacteria bacterium]|nr:O-antigen ligase family protein [Candidatus Parcubacteria bacterium]